MSRRDQDYRSGAGTNAQELLTVVKELLSDVDWKDVQFRADCRWKPLGLVIAAFIWAWSSKTTLTGRFGQALKVARSLGRKLAPLQTSYQAFIKLLVRWTGELKTCLMLAFQLVMKRELPEQFRFAGFVVLGGDGSKLQLARTRSNEARYSSAKTQRHQRQKRRRDKRRYQRARARAAQAQRAKDKKADSPQLALTLLFHVMLRLPWDWRIGPYDSSEREHLLDMIPSLPSDALIVADCGFVGYEFWSALLASERQFVIRVGGNVRLLKKLGVVQEGNGIVYLWPKNVAKRGQKPLVVRLVEVHDGRQSWNLATSVLDTQRLSDRQVAEIYGRRWRIEITHPDYPSSDRLYGVSWAA